MSIEEQVKARIALKDVPSATKNFYRLVLGEFNRVDDAKPVTDEQAIAVIKKMIKSNLEMIKLVGDVERIALQYENSIMENLMPKEIVAADMDMLLAIENSIPNHVSNKIRHMKAVIQCLEDRGFAVDKKRLSELLRGLN